MGLRNLRLFAILVGLMVTISSPNSAFCRKSDVGQPASASSAPKPIDLIFDLDWTAFYAIENQESNFLDSQVVESFTTRHRATDYLGEVIYYLVSIYPEIRISFASGGEAERNSSLLEKVKMPDGRSLLDIAHSVLSKSDLTEVAKGEGLRFAERYKKVMDRKIPDIDYNRAVLIDDVTEFALSPLVAIRSLGTMTFQRRFDPLMAAKDWFPRTKREWQMERRKALAWLGAIVSAEKRSRETDEPFSKILLELWGVDDRKALRLLNSAQIAAFTRQGEKLLQGFRRNEMRLRAKAQGKLRCKDFFAN